MRNVPKKCVKCGRGWHENLVTPSGCEVTYNILDEELVVKCSRCGYITCCDPDDKEIENAGNAKSK